MTRETKIGLLVGLAFLIVIGILLSDYHSSVNDPTSAPLAVAGPNVREGTMTPAPSAPSGSVPPVTVVPAPADAPRRPVPGHADLTSAVPSPVRVTTPALSGAPSQAAPPVAPEPSPLASGDGAKPPAGAPDRGRNGIQTLLAEHPEDLAPVDDQPPRKPAPGKPALPKAPASDANTRQTTYVAVAGDNVWKIAAKCLGTNSKAARDLVIKANPSLQGEGSPVVAGKTYVIPSGPALASLGGAAPTPVTPAAPTAHQQTGSTPAEGSFRWYTVQQNDNLWKIAEAQLGSGNAWLTIKDLNKDLLKGGETVHPNMRLRLPNKSPVAAVN